MKAAPEDRLTQDSRRRGFSIWHGLIVIAIVAMGVILWNVLPGEDAPQAVVEAEVIEELVIEPAALPPAPDIPTPPEPVPVVETPVADQEPVPPPPPPPPLPPLAASDDLMREQLSAAGVGPELASLDDSENLVETSAALVDGLSRGIVLRKLLPVARPAEPFTVEQRGARTFMNPAGYRRYDKYAQAIAAVDTEVVIESFHRLRPLYEQAYVQLGLEPGDFDNAIIRVLDRIIATPEIEQPIELTRKSVMYRYADPQLEQLSAVQKQLLRMGPDNTRRIKAQAEVIRKGLLTQ